MERQPYFERQVGGNCRIHAVNMALQRKALDVSQLHSIGRLFSQLHDLPDAVPFDYTASDGLTLPAFCIERVDDSSHCLGLNFPSANVVYGFPSSSHLLSSAPGLESVVRGALISNTNHVWACIPGWHLDSMSSPGNIGRRSIGSLFRDHHVALVLDRRSCWKPLRTLVSRALQAQKAMAGNGSWEELLSSRFYEADDPQKPKLHVRSMLGHLFTLLAVALRADCRCGSPEVKEAAKKAVADLKSKYAVMVLDRGKFVATVAPLLRAYASL